MKNSRYWTTVVLLALAVVALYGRGDSDHIPPSTPLTEFPRVIDDMISSDRPIDPESLAILGQGFFLNRVFMPAELEFGRRGAPGIGLFIAYFPTQRTGQSIHSPQNCLPGSGWTFESSGTTQVAGADGHMQEIADYTIVNGNNRAEVLYWYQSHGRTIASDYKAKLYMLMDSIRYGRSDAALVRIVVPIQPSEGRDAAHVRAIKFAQHLIPTLPSYIPN